MLATEVECYLAVQLQLVHRSSPPPSAEDMMAVVTHESAGVGAAGFEADPRIRWPDVQRGLSPIVYMQNCRSRGEGPKTDSFRRSDWAFSPSSEPGFGYRYYQRIEAGEKDLRLSTLNRLANTFKVSTRDLFDFN